jgi:uncharacterized protein with HEPN domain
LTSSDRKWAYRIEHILDAIAKIQQYTGGMDESAFAANDLVIDAVIRNFQFIGEAARNIPAGVQAKHAHIPWASMIGMQNVIVHGYDVVRLDIVWRTIGDHLPPLIDPLRKLRQVARIEEGGAS